MVAFYMPLAMFDAPNSPMNDVNQCNERKRARESENSIPDIHLNRVIVHKITPIHLMRNTNKR